MTTSTPPPDPAVNATWIDDADELYYFNGKIWVRYDDPPKPLTGRDSEPMWLEKGATHGESE